MKDCLLPARDLKESMFSFFYIQSLNAFFVLLNTHLLFTCLLPARDIKESTFSFFFCVHSLNAFFVLLNKHILFTCLFVSFSVILYHMVLCRVI